MLFFTILVAPLCLAKRFNAEEVMDMLQTLQVYAMQFAFDTLYKQFYTFFTVIVPSLTKLQNRLSINRFVWKAGTQFK